MKSYRIFLISTVLVFNSCSGQNKETNDYSNIIFIDSTVNSFDSLIAKFKGSVVYVDIWASWCLPCRREFKSLGFLQNMAADNKIILLYISGDKNADSVKWKNIIYKNSLQGYHIRMSNQLKTEIIKRFSRPLKSTGELALIYPTYLILNYEGNVVNFNAPKPSEKEKLLQELKRFQ
ncbi:MAG: redoxin family protein [Chitinophagales bacterium]|nr:redoxin family protein [Chitinophagales bacterium]